MRTGREHWIVVHTEVAGQWTLSGNVFLICVYQQLVGIKYSATANSKLARREMSCLDVQKQKLRVSSDDEECRNSRVDEMLDDLGKQANGEELESIF